MRDANTVAAIVNALRQVHGDDLARVMLNDGFSLAILIDVLLRSPLKNRDAVKLITSPGISSSLRTSVLSRISNILMTIPNRCTSLT